MKAAEWFAQGESSSAIAKELRVSVRCVRRWRRSWDKMGRGPCARPGQRGSEVGLRPVRPAEGGFDKGAGGARSTGSAVDALEG
ncbi:helix-turn-helix domain-containing protein [Streptomyces sp. NPDC088847]|uniref:helix-turn-helix domain-containing protein n=1 Tax=Streptomyces sp. NPDC088847 TaxID=3365909 RepID=UPI00382C1AC8